VNEIHDAKQFLENKIADANDSRMMLFNELIAFMERVSVHDYQGAEESLQAIVGMSQGDLYKEVGKVTRKLHDSVKSFKDALDPRVHSIATQDMPEAVDRLNYVIDKTEEAANLTMGIVDKYMLGMGGLKRQIQSLQGPDEALRYLERFQAELEEDMTTILTTQSFQDLTGQTIRKVIRLVMEIEAELVKLIATFGVKAEETKFPEKLEAEIISQSDVDDLLKDFGF
jgi:chemotaxis protein CheZ